MKIIFDTNVLISGFITTTGTSQYILSRCCKRHQIILSEYILHEFEEIMSKKFRMPPILIRRARIFLEKHCSIQPASQQSKEAFSDLKDMPILDLVETVKPHYLITGNKKLLAVKKMGPTLFLSPREAMEIL